MAILFAIVLFLEKAQLLAGSFRTPFNLLTDHYIASFTTPDFVIM